MDASGIQEGLRNINHFVIFAAMMKTVYTILFSFCLLLLCSGAYAQRISDSGYRTIGYIQSFIVEKGKNLLMQGYNVSETSHLLGFDYPHHFNRIFKKVAGITPRQFLGQ